MTQEKKELYFDLRATKILDKKKAVDIANKVISTLTDLSQKFFELRMQALMQGDIEAAKSASDQQLGVDFMILNVDELILSQIDNSVEIMKAIQTIKKVNKKLDTIRADGKKLAKDLEDAVTLLEEFEKLVGWVKAK